MGIYLKKFENHTLYDSYINGGDAILPNVSIYTTEEDVHYNSYVLETMVVAKYNVTSTSSPTPLRTSFESNIFKSMEIDGVMLDELVTEYTFDTTGEHTVKYELYDETKLGNNAPVFYNSNLVEIIIPNSVTSICTNALLNCSGLTSCIIGSGVTSIGQAVFANCSSLTSIDIPDSVTFISNGAFDVCTGLTSVTIGNSVTSIGDNAFSRCSSLTSIVCNAMIAPTIQSDTFYDVKIGGTLTVPAGSTGYDVWMGTSIYYLGSYSWTKVEQ